MSVRQCGGVATSIAGDHVKISQFMEQLQHENIQLRIKLMNVELNCQQLKAGKTKYKKKYLRARDQLKCINPNYQPSQEHSQTASRTMSRNASRTMSRNASSSVFRNASRNTSRNEKAMQKIEVDYNEYGLTGNLMNAKNYHTEKLISNEEEEDPFVMKRMEGISGSLNKILLQMDNIPKIPKDFKHRQEDLKERIEYNTAKLNEALKPRRQNSVTDKDDRRKQFLEQIGHSLTHFKIDL